MISCFWGSHAGSDQSTTINKKEENDFEIVWQGRESKIRTISRGTVLFLGETINKRKRKEPLHNVPSDGFEAVSLSFHSLAKEGFSIFIEVNGKK